MGLKVSLIYRMKMLTDNTFGNHKPCSIGEIILSIIYLVNFTWFFFNFFKNEQYIMCRCLYVKQLNSIKILIDVSLVSKVKLMIPGVPVYVENQKK